MRRSDPEELVACHGDGLRRKGRSGRNDEDRRRSIVILIDQQVLGKLAIGGVALLDRTLVIENGLLHMIQRTRERELLRKQQQKRKTQMNEWTRFHGIDEY